MKTDTHPTYFEDAKATCACGAVFVVGSTKKKFKLKFVAPATLSIPEMKKSLTRREEWSDSRKGEKQELPQKRRG